MRRYGRRRLPALVLTATAMLTACGGSGGKSNSSNSTAAGGPNGVSSVSTTVPQGGDITLSAEQEPQCTDWLSSCAATAASLWGVYMLQANTMPRAYDFTPRGYEPSNLLTAPATVTPGAHPVITYHINPKAVWSDGQPITSRDFAYTWDQVVHGTDISSTAGYSSISAVNDTNPHTAVVTFSAPYGHWQQLFGGYFGILPSHILQNEDRDSAMRNGYTFSGGPWKLQRWIRGQSLTLIPNDTYWGKRPNLDSVTFDFITDPVEEQQEYRSGAVSALFPPPEPLTAGLRSAPDTQIVTTDGLSFEALWFNLQSTPVNDPAVRAALAYSTDRPAIAALLSKITGAPPPVVQSTYTPAAGAVYSEPFAKYQRSLAEVDRLMGGDGWTRGPDGVWTKAGAPAAVQIKTTTDDPRRQQIAQALQSQWQSAGFRVSIVTETPAALFGDDLPTGNFDIALYALTASDNDPEQCIIWCSSAIPTANDHYVGQNFTRLAGGGLDQLWSAVASGLVPATRIADAQHADAILAGLLPVLPLEALPEILVVNTQTVGIEGGHFSINLEYGPFADLAEWYEK